MDDRLNGMSPKLLNELKGGARTKHLNKRGIAKFLSMLKGEISVNKVEYLLPKEGAVPLEFIRQEPWEIEYLYSIGAAAKRGIVETGRFNGGSALIFSASNKQVPIWSIDIAPLNDERLRNICSELNIGENLELIVGDSQNSKYEQIANYDVLFIDGDHTYQGCLNDLENWWPMLDVGGHVLLHDCYLGNEVQTAAIDFFAKHNVAYIQSPWRGHEHWRYPAGSICHVIKL